MVAGLRIMPCADISLSALYVCSLGVALITVTLQTRDTQI